LAILIFEDDAFMANELRSLISGGGGSALPLAVDDTALTILVDSRPDAVLLAAGGGWK
jgi:hypothetical protein